MILDQNVEKNAKQEKDLQRLHKECSSLTIQIEKLQEVEQRAQELISQASIHAETIATLQKDLINEKINNEKFKSNLEKLGLTPEILDNDINVIVEKMLGNPEISKNILSICKAQIEEEEPCKKCAENVHSDVLLQAEEVASSISAEWSKQCDKLYSEISNLQSLNDSLQNENATLKVDISTLKSQVNSLQTQQTALQLANSQLVAEKDEVRRYFFATVKTVNQLDD